jgi:SPP1 gp7 family putative phage head morphogenesis protein
MQVKVENGTFREILLHWREISQGIAQRVLMSGLIASESGVSLQMGALRSLLSDVARVLGVEIEKIKFKLEHDLRDFIRSEVHVLPQMLDSVVNARMFREAEGDQVSSSERLNVLFSLVPEEQIAQLLASTAGGAFHGMAFDDFAQQAFRQIRNTLVYGLAQGDDIATVARRVRQVMGNQQYQAERIVRTEYVRAATQAALLTYQRNAGLLRGIQWVATLDNRTCLQCAALDGRIFTDLREATLPPVHIQCRCVIIPILGNARQLGLLQANPTTRASFSGQVPATLTYPEWFDQQDQSFQRDVLGPTRFRLFQSGQMNLRQFVTPSGIKPVSDLPTD